MNLPKTDQYQCKVCNTICEVDLTYGNPVVCCPKCGKYYITNQELYTLVCDYEIIEDSPDTPVSHKTPLLSEETVVVEERPKRGRKAERNVS